ncbi:hypothetical protein AB0L35_10035 [Streptomyces sp. NPDC052309]|uniref:hypothetical protein n=1 Tax=Streptomyces sp. NPDC052309 TaxID=3155421 RepID=UPI003418B34F
MTSGNQYTETRATPLRPEREARDIARADIGGYFEGNLLGVRALGGEAGAHASGSSWGVFGDTENASKAAVAGLGQGRGGAFGSQTKGPQLYLEPKGIGDRAERSVAPKELIPPGDLPFNGLIGDFYAVTLGVSGQAALYFCVRSQEGMRGAFWAQVLTGVAVEGKRGP